ncbi:MAG: tetratricopeptide repeat protein [Phototrophicaceae bacterium]
MKRFILVVSFLLLTISVSGQSLEQAEEAYQNRNYSAAIGLYEAALLEGNLSGEVYFNLGNAYFITGELGQAIVNYRIAEQYLPRDRAIENQLARARRERVDGIFPESDWLVILSNITTDTLTLTETATIAFITWIAFFFIWAIGIRQKRYKITISLLAVIMLISVGLLSARLYVETQRPAGVILSADTAVMTGPGDNYLSLFTLYEGAEMRILDEREGWVRIMLPDNRQGWIRESTMRFVRIQSIGQG